MRLEGVGDGVRPAAGVEELVEGLLQNIADLHFNIEKCVYCCLERNNNKQENTHKITKRKTSKETHKEKR